jgi:hypothetical protein
MSLHLSILEQLSIDQPAGIKAAYQALQIKHGDAQAAQHQIMDCLVDTMWRSQREGQAPDGAVYLQCIQHKST